AQLRASERAPVDHYVAVRFDVDHYITDGGSLFFSRRSFRHFYIELILAARRVPGHEKENEKKKQNIDKRRKLNARMNRSGSAAQIHMSAMSIIDEIAT